MQVSQFEIYRLVQRALEGLGAGYGVDRDAAFAVAWLEARGLPGLASLAADLARLERGIGPTKLEPGARSDFAIDAGGASAIAFAGAVLDLLIARATAPGTGRARLRLRRCCSPLSLIPAAAENGSGVALQLAWQGQRSLIRVRVEADGGATLFLSPGEELRTALLAPATSEVEIQVALSSEALPPPKSGLIAVLDREGLARRLAHSLDHGIDVDPTIWRRIDEVAARVQVPASEESRLKGAGGGDANA
jgi:hypothetical protein